MPTRKMSGSVSVHILSSGQLSGNTRKGGVLTRIDSFNFLSRNLVLAPVFSLSWLASWVPKLCVAWEWSIAEPFLAHSTQPLPLSRAGLAWCLIEESPLSAVCACARWDMAGAYGWAVPLGGCKTRSCCVAGTSAAGR